VTENRVEVGLLGPVTVCVDGRERALTARRQRALLAYLALHPGEAVSADRLLDAIWGDDLPETRVRSVAFQISKLRSALEPERRDEGSLIVTTSAGYRLDIDPDDVDVHRCRRLVAEARARLVDDPAASERLAESALALWRGRALADLGAERFVDAELVRLDRQRLLAHRTLVEARLASGRHVDVVGELETLVDQHPLEESLVQLLMTAYHRSGRIADALRAHRELRVRLGTELGIEPSRGLQQLEQQLLAGSDIGAMPAGGRRGPGRPLPTPITSFVGRDEEIDAITSALSSNRLVTLCGFGGLGKTRLALEIARRHGERFGGAWFVDLTAVESAGAIADAFVAAGGVRGGRRRARDRLIAHLSDVDALVVVDCCEHLVDAVADIVSAILGATPRVRVLATSRVALGVRGEMVWMVGPMAAGTDRSLFVDRARLARPDFEVDAGNLDDVLRVCERLDGIPLAIEMAAARLSMMSVRQLVQRLDDRFRLLTRAGRRSEDRQASVAAVLDWSYRLLDEADRALLRRMSVCVGGFDLAAATAIGTTDAETSPAEVIDRLGHLVDMSLVAFDDHDGVPRFRILDTVRQFAREQLERGGPDEARSAGYAHAAHYEGMARAVSDLDARDHREFLRLGDREVGNIRAAIEWAYAHGHPRLGLRVARAMWSYFGERVNWRAKRYIRDGLELIDEDDIEVLEAAALSLLDESSDFDLGYQADAQARVERGLASVDDPEVRSTLLRGLAASFAFTDPRAAERYLLLAIAEQPVSARTRLSAIHNRCVEAWFSGGIGDAGALLQRLAETGAGVPATASSARCIEAMIAAATARWADAVRIADVASAMDDLDQFHRYCVDAALLEALLALGHPEQAVAVLRRLQSDDTGVSGYYRTICAPLIEAPTMLACGDPPAAVRTLTGVVDHMARDPRRLAIAAPTAWMLGIAAHDLGQDETAAAMFGFATAEQERLDIVLRPCDRPRAERALGACRSRLGGARFAQLAAQGAASELRDLPQVTVA
jgi:predicted ATPase